MTAHEHNKHTTYGLWTTVVNQCHCVGVSVSVHGTYASCRKVGRALPWTYLPPTRSRRRASACAYAWQLPP